MNFESFFKLSSYALVLAGMLSLLVAGGIGVFVAAGFTAAVIIAWRLEGTKWQLSERMGLIVIFAMLPLFYLDYVYRRSGGGLPEQVMVATLARVILALAAIKLLQIKTDRDWFVIYLISFFEVLLSAAFSISIFLSASFIVYLFLAVTTIIVFEIRKSHRAVTEKRVHSLKALQKEFPEKRDTSLPRANYRLPVTAGYLLLITLIVAVPLFFFLPRVGSAGLGAGSQGLRTSTGFSDSVNLGAIAQIQQNNEVVMRVRLESGRPPNYRNFKWRGVALDNFDRKTWRRSQFGQPVADYQSQDGWFRLGNESGNKMTVIQSVYLEPLDSKTLFGLSQMIRIRGNFESITRDYNGSLATPLLAQEGRINYRVISDTYVPPDAELRLDEAITPLSHKHYLQMPAKMDPRFGQLTAEIIRDAKAANHYDAAKAVETYLQTQLGYTLNLTAKGDDPLADFLFNVREGHCEYFASAMAMMLRTQGIATRIVNGFQAGEYNDTAGFYIVRQKDAHSWVEVYFPQTDSWVTFDPTPAAGRNSETTASAGILTSINSYMEALETFWVQYIVAYDNQEQRSMLRAFRQNFSSYQFQINAWLSSLQRDLTKTYEEARGGEGVEKQVSGTLKIAGAIVIFCLAVVGLLIAGRYLWRMTWWNRLFDKFEGDGSRQVIEFYSRMIAALTAQGLVRQPYQTPVEFAGSLAMPEAAQITEAYNLVRYGERPLTAEHRANIEKWLAKIESKE